MQRKKQAWAVIVIAITPIGGTIGRPHLIGPNPGTYFALGVLAALSVLGIAYSVWEARRVVRLGLPIDD